MAETSLEQLLATLGKQSINVLDATIPKSEYMALVLSVTNQNLKKVDVSSSEKLGAYIDDFKQKHHATVAFGGYLEKRGIYQRSDYFNNTASAERNIHLGLDLWIAAETPIYAPISGEIHSFQNNTNFGDYGPTLILKHEIDSQVFYTLYGHLSIASLTAKKIGEKVQQGAQIATLGDASVNGDYPPHLHFQIIKNIGNYTGDYPGVASSEDVAFYKQNCPDPKLLLNLTF